MGTGDRFQRLIEKGPKIRCSFSGMYDYQSNMVSDQFGGQKRKTWDIFVNFPESQKSKIRRGSTWQRGYL